MPFLRATRDKRGYETTFVVHTYRTGSGAGQTRVLYFFRTPANVTAGRRPLDDEARVALEHTHPDLSFDWQALDRELATIRSQTVGRPSREGRAGRAPQRASQAPQTARAAEVPEDRSVLARAIGGREAARLRARYAELVDRVERRARGPEERDQLLERLRRLNPDDWPDESAVRAGVSTVEAEWETIGSGLPSRRRGRRGGRRRGQDLPAATGQASGIMAEGGDVHEAHEEDEDAQMARPGLDSGDPGDDDRVGGPGPGDGLPGDD